MTIETIATFAHGVWTRPVPDYSRPHVPGGNGAMIAVNAEDQVVVTNCLFGDESTLEYVAWKAAIDKAVAGKRRRLSQPDPIRAQLLAALKECFRELGTMPGYPNIDVVNRVLNAIAAADKPQ